MVSIQCKIIVGRISILIWEEDMLKLGGIIAAMVTPMTEDEKVDETGSKKLVDRLVTAGVYRKIR